MLKINPKKKKNSLLLIANIYLCINLIVLITNLALAESRYKKSKIKKHKTKQIQSQGQLQVKPDIEDIVYVEGGNPRFQSLDIFLSKGFSGARPVVICIHGGGWGRGTEANWSWEANELAKKGFVALAIQYRLAPKYPYPAAIEDCRSVVTWIQRNAPKYNIDPSRIAAMGSSAGGHLVALLGTMDTPEKIKYIVDYYGPTDFRYPEAKTRKSVQGFLGGAGEGVYTEASAITHVSSNDATFLILHGRGDRTVPIEQSREFCQALKQAGVEVTLVEYAQDVGHGFRKGASVDDPKYAKDPKVKAGKDAWEESVEFLIKHLNP